MSQTLTDRVKAIKNTPGTGENVLVSEINGAFDKFDNNFVPSAKIVNTATQAVTSGSTQPIVFNTTRHDTYAARAEGPMADLLNDLIVIRKNGLYMVSLSADFAGNVSTAGYRAISIKRGATIMKRITQDANTVTNVDTAMELSDIFVLTAGDQISATALQTSGVSINLDPTIGGVNDSVSLAVAWLGGSTEV